MPSDLKLVIKEPGRPDIVIEDFEKDDDIAVAICEWAGDLSIEAGTSIHILEK